MNISTGKQIRPQKVVIYGSEGIGKSTLASNFPAPVFADVEGGTAQLDVARITSIENWQALLADVAEIATSDEGIKTLVIDTADKAELMCIDYICSKFKKGGIEEFGYGKGYTYLQEEFKKLLDLADECIRRGKNVVLLAHAKMRKFEQPDEMGAYDRWEMKLTKQVAPLVKEWADMVLFLNYKTTVVVNEAKKSKAVGGKRIIYTNHHPCWDAKNRHGFPEEMSLEWAGPLKDVFTAELPANVQCAEMVFGGQAESTVGQEPVKLTNVQVVEKLIENNHLTEDVVMDVLKSAGMCDGILAHINQVPNDVLENVIQYWDQLVTQIQSDVPF